MFETTNQRISSIFKCQITQIGDSKTRRLLKAQVGRLSQTAQGVILSGRQHAPKTYSRCEFIRHLAHQQHALQPKAMKFDIWNSRHFRWVTWGFLSMTQLLVLELP